MKMYRLFCESCNSLGILDDTVIHDTFDDLKNIYSTRAYHNMKHIEQLLGVVRRFYDRNDIDDMQYAELSLAVWYHDIVQDHDSTDRANVIRSAELAEMFLKSMATEDMVKNILLADTVSNLIYNTYDHCPEHDDVMGKIISDGDLQILSLYRDGYIEYVQSIETEYSDIHPIAFNLLRMSFLTEMCARPLIYYTDLIGHDSEWMARENMSWELEQRGNARTTDDIARLWQR